MNETQENSTGRGTGSAELTRRARCIPQLIHDEPGLVAHSGPQQYVFRPGAYDDLPRLLRVGGYSRVAILHGRIGWSKARVYLPDSSDLVGPNGSILDIPFSGECCIEEIERVRALVVDRDIHAILAIGGGKVLDTAKAAGLRAGDIPVILLPTLASNCSAWACLSVLYEADGTPVGHEVHPTQVAAVVIDPRVLVDSPVEYLRAGIADTLAKWYECSGALDDAPSWDLSAGLARHAALQCRNLLTAHGVAALRDLEAERATDSLLTVFQVNIQIAGLVGSFGGAYGRATAAHAIHDGLSVLPSQQGALHGIKVAYGTLVQLALENRWEELDELDSLYDELGLPHSLDELGVTEESDEAIATIARVATLPMKTIHQLAGRTRPVAEKEVDTAIRALEDHERERVSSTALVPVASSVPVPLAHPGI